MVGPRLWLQMAALLAAFGIAVIVEDSTTGRMARAEDEIPASRGASEGILVMRTGAVVTGKILRSGNQYEVQSPAGTMAVPDSLVKLFAPNLAEGYRKLRVSAQTQNSANAHITLAQWCLTNHLDSEARQELRDALALEPDREDAKKLMRTAEEAGESREKMARRGGREDSAPVARAVPNAPEDAVSLGGLSRDEALQFSRRIQPLLVNNCTAAGCHGRDSRTGFRLTRVTPGKDANRHAAERNLAEIIEQIDLKKPRASRLLTAPCENHGRRGRPVFAGPRGEEQFAELARWVALVAKDEVVREKRGERESQTASAVLGASAGDAGPGKTAGSLSALRGSLGSGKTAPFGRADAKRPEQPPLPPGKGDPFDPASFNRSADRRAAR